MKVTGSTVDLWLIPPSALDSFCNPADFCLSSEELICAARYAGAGKASWYAKKQAAVRYVLASYAECEPSSVCFLYGPQGKPSLPGDGSLEFNLSHSNGYTVAAVTRGIPIGLDIEYIKSHPRDELAMRILGPVAAERYCAMNERERSISFSIAWSEREALGKMLGFGIGDGWRRVTSIFRPHDLIEIPKSGASRIIGGHAFYYLNLLPSYSFVFCTCTEISFVNVNHVRGYDDFVQGGHYKSSDLFVALPEVPEVSFPSGEPPGAGVYSSAPP